MQGMTPQTQTRPPSVTITLWGVILFGVWNLGRAVAIGQQMTLAQSLSIQPDPRLRLLGAMLWAANFWGAAVQLWRKRPSTRYLIPLLFLLYAIYNLGLAACWVQSPIIIPSWSLAITFYLSTTFLSAWALNTTPRDPHKT